MTEPTNDQLDRLASINNRMIGMPIHNATRVHMHFWHSMQVRAMRNTPMSTDELLEALESAMTWAKDESPAPAIDFDKPLFPQAVAIMAEAGRWRK